MPSDQDELPYSDWVSLVAGIMENTPLGQTVLIRKENDRERLKHFSKHERNIRNEWRNFRAGQKRDSQSPQDVNHAMEMFENMFREMFSK